MADVYITGISKFLPNESISNDQIESYLGLINNKPSKAKNIILRSNGIKYRYYAMNKEGAATHTNAEMVSLAIRKLFENASEELSQIDLLACGTATPDQLLPSHAVMVHGLLPETSNIEVVSQSGSCCAGMHALKYAYLSVKSGDKKKALCCGSERVSPILKADTFKEEAKRLIALENDPYIAFEKDFLRWMLSDGAGVFLLENKKAINKPALKIEWIELSSYANIAEPCMYMGGDKLPDGNLKGYMDMSSEEIISNSALSLKQDTRILSENIIKLGFSKIKDILDKKGLDINDVDYFLPHISSNFFRDKIEEVLKQNGIPIPESKWFTNLTTKGNIGSASIYLMLEELFNEHKLKAGGKILMVVPESARFSYAFCLLTIC